MANFQAAVNVIDATSSACWLQISDVSNYTTNTQAGHGLAKFKGYFKVKVIKPDSSIYCYSSVGGCDLAVQNPADAIFSTVYNFSQTDINGTYTIQLCTVPYFEPDATTSYYVNTNDVVWYNGQLWACLGNGIASTPSTNNTDWLAISETVLETNYPQYCVSVNSVVNCLSDISFQGALDVSVDNECTKLIITDYGNYVNNDEAGHALLYFKDYRKVTVVRPDGTTYVFSSLGDGDDTVSAPDSGNNTINYQFLDSDEDGIYEVIICAYPTWDASVSYDTSPDPEVVYYDVDGNLYKSLVDNNLGNTPDTSTDEWELYTTTQEDSLLTRYCSSFKIAVICLDILECLERLTYQAFCEIDNDFCNDDILCKNKTFLNAVKLRLLVDAMQISVNKSAWDEVLAQFNLMKTICNCN